MRVIFLSNYLTHHQKPLADEMYKLLGEGNYVFVSTEDVSEERKQMGWPELNAPYLIHLKEETKDFVDSIIGDFDVVVYGDAPLRLVKDRYKTNSKKLTFCYSERRYKTISRYFKYPIFTYKSFFLNKGFLLAASAYAPKDFYLSGMRLKRCFKWGYFPDVRLYECYNELLEKKRLKRNKDVSILWAGRFLRWKHPELAVYVAKRLHDDGIDFTMNIIGEGALKGSLKKTIDKYKLNNCVHFMGTMPPNEVRDLMEKSDIFLFTSNRCEGWGAVLNEAMNSGCAVIASDAIGSTPYLIKDNHNGLLYKDGQKDDLYQKVRHIIESPQKRQFIQEKAYEAIIKEWNPKQASMNFLKLCHALLKGEQPPIEDGPASSASLIFDKWIL